MDFDATIERLNALKLQERGAPPPPAASDETQRLQEENARMALEHERQAQRWQLEMHEMQRRMDAAERQNQLLKSALGEMDTYRQEMHTQQLVIEELQGQVRQLRMANLRLQYVVQQRDGHDHNGFMPPQPPDVF
jgi:hypothetical protein